VINTKEPAEKKSSSLTAKLSIVFSLLTVATLIALHFLSPELDPSWRMVSEYANGNYSWLLSVMFGTWALSSWSLAFTLRSQLVTRRGKVGLALLVISGIGEGMAAIFDINENTGHTLASILGIGGLAIAAPIIAKALGRADGWSQYKDTLKKLSRLPWITVLLMVVSFIFLMVTYSQSGADMKTPPEVLPEGVIGVVGWANRLLILVYLAWIMVIAKLSINVRNYK
jgi:hypothetical protein